jgi:tRNA threonylcarbamoyladenosine biosynthesis protein TsaB
MALLALTTSSRRGGAAVDLGPGRLYGTWYDDLHAERVFATIDEALADAGIEREALDAIACDIGPGSFTGVRVGVAAAKGIAMGLGAPLVGVCSLAAMAAAGFAAADAGEGASAIGLEVVLALLDAKRDEVFAAAYDRQGVCLLDPCHLPRGDAASLLGRTAAGRRLVVVGEVAAELLAGGPVLRGEGTELPDARWVARLARARLAAGAGASAVELDPAALEPLYVRAPDAKLPTGVLG